MWEAIASVVIATIAAGKIWMFVHAVRQALARRPAPGSTIDPDGPDDSWRWWEQFGPDPGTPPGSRDRVLLRRS